MSEQPCAYCHGVSERPGVVIHATRFQVGEAEGDLITYHFCDDGCRKAWLYRAEELTK